MSPHALSPINILSFKFCNRILNGLLYKHIRMPQSISLFNLLHVHWNWSLHVIYIIQWCFLGIWRGVLFQNRLRMPTAYKPCLWNWPENLRQWVFTKLHVSLVLTFPFTVRISNTFQKASKPGRGGAESNTYRVMRQCNEHKIN